MMQKNEKISMQTIQKRLNLYAEKLQNIQAELASDNKESGEKLLYTNVAFKKPTAQSSIHNAKKFDPHGACNGKKTGGFGFHTQKENQPWWQIDLQGSYQLTEIKVYNRINLEERASTLDILLSQDALNWYLCFSNKKENVFGGIEGEPLIVNLQSKVARFVRLQLREHEFLHLDEVEIYGSPVQSNGSSLDTGNHISPYVDFEEQSNLQPSPHLMQNLIMNMLFKLQMYDTEIEEVRIGSLGDGGYVIPNDLAGIKGLISIGIGREVSFDLDFAERGIKVFQYDHTVEEPPISHKNFLFHKVGWSDRNSDGFITLSKILENNHLNDDSDLVLKFDVEKAEWDALSNVSPDLLKRFRIITCELHRFDLLEDVLFFEKVKKIIDLLTKHHTVTHIHPNNCCGVVLVAGIVVPKVIEFSFLRNDRSSFYPSHDSIPSGLDYPNMKRRPEIILTPFQMGVPMASKSLTKKIPKLTKKTSEGSNIIGKSRETYNGYQAKSPSREIPEELKAEFTLNHKIPIIYSFYDDSRTSPVHLNMEAYHRAFAQLEQASFKYYGNTLDYLLSSLERYQVANKSVLIFGLTGVNCDAISLWKGATKVYVVDYNLPVSEHPKVQVLSYEDYINQNIQADAAISISSFEHDGLGRYGDPINPNGDLEAMKLAKKLIVKNGLLFFSVPIGKDCLVWNAHRIYGKIRLPMLLEGWEVLDTFGFSESLMVDRKLGYYQQPVFVLKNL
jgi:hypothetical protein